MYYMYLFLSNLVVANFFLLFSFCLILNFNLSQKQKKDCVLKTKKLEEKVRWKNQKLFSKQLALCLVWLSFKKNLLNIKEICIYVFQIHTP